MDSSRSFPLDPAMLDPSKQHLDSQSDPLHAYGPEVVNQSDKYKLQRCVFAKEKELAAALVKVAELTAQLEKLRAACSAEDEKGDTTGGGGSSFQRMVELGLMHDQSQYSMEECRRLKPDQEYNYLSSSDYHAAKSEPLVAPPRSTDVAKDLAPKEAPTESSPTDNGINTNGSMKVNPKEEELPGKEPVIDDLQWKTSLTVSAMIYSTMIVPKVLTDSISFVADESAAQSHQPKPASSFNNPPSSVLDPETTNTGAALVVDSTRNTMMEKNVSINGDSRQCDLKKEPENNNRLQSTNGVFSNGVESDTRTVQLLPAVSLNGATRNPDVSQIVINNGRGQIAQSNAFPAEIKYIDADAGRATKYSNLVKSNPIGLVNNAGDGHLSPSATEFVAPSVDNKRNDPSALMVSRHRHHHPMIIIDGEHAGKTPQGHLTDATGRKVSENDSSQDGSVSSMSSISSIEEIRSVDTSVDSVNSALSVLLKVAPGAAVTDDIPASPRCGYRYASRSAVSNVYRRKLGVGGSDSYSTNMSQIYGAGNFLGSKRTESVDDTPSPDVQRRFLVSASPFSPPALSPAASDLFADDTESRTQSRTHADWDEKPSAEPDVPSNSGHARTRCNAPHPVRRMFSSNVAPTPLYAPMFNLTSPPPTPPNSVTTPLLTPFRLMQHSLSFNEFVDSSADDEDSLEFFNAKNVLHLTKSPSFPATTTAVNSASITAYIDDQYSAVYGNMRRNAGQVQTGSATSILRSTERRSKQSLAPRRVTFENVSLLLSAALEGELDVVKETLPMISDASKSNSEGVTALHNAACGGHCDVALYLIQHGANVNAVDDDGWTPLHCAASGNHLNAIRLLVEHGACISARTCDTNETPVQKCPKLIAGFEDCFKYFIEAEQQLGVVNKGELYVVNKYEGCRPDELSLNDGDRIKILRRGDQRETDWWWARSKGTEGYVPKTVLATYPKYMQIPDER